MKKYFLGIDLGTSSVKSLLMGEDGTVAGTAQQEYDISKPRQEYAEQDMDKLWNAAADTIRTLMREHAECRDLIAGIGYSGQMHGLVMLDENNRQVRDTIIWADQRSGESIRHIYETIPEDEYRGVVLNSLSTGFLVSSLVWVRENEPENYEKIRHVMLPKDYIRFRMCGELGSDMSDASSTAIFDTAGRNWAWDLIRRLGLREEIFVPCREAYDIAGRVTRECAELTGLPEGIPIVYGGGDTLVQAVGNGITGKGSLISNIGTASQLVCLSDTPIYDPKFRTNTFCHVADNTWLLMGANLSGGVALKWLKNNVLGMDSYQEMTELAEQAQPGSDGLLFLPYLSGERTPWNDPDARGIFFGLSLKHEKKEIIRAVMEGIIFSQRATFEIFKEMNLSFDRVIASGGGARGSVFRKVLASQFDCEVVTNEVNEQGCIGAAMIAAVGTGAFSSFEEACEKIVRFKDEVTEPDPEMSRIYTERYQVFKELYPANRNLFVR